jgi:predicted Fe-Mo cluster-binding NifX family protein
VAGATVEGTRKRIDRRERAVRAVADAATAAVAAAAAASVEDAVSAAAGGGRAGTAARRLTSRTAGTEAEVRVCVASEGAELDSPVDSRFGRAAHLLVVDTESGEIEELAGATGAAHGAGVEAAQAVLRALPAALVVNRLGPKAHDLLAAAEIPVYRAEGVSVAQALRLLEAGMLPALAGSGEGKRSA